MCFEMSFGKYQLQGKKSNNVGSFFLCTNDADNIFSLENESSKCFGRASNIPLCLHGMLLFICTWGISFAGSAVRLKACHSNWDFYSIQYPLARALQWTVGTAYLIAADGRGNTCKQTNKYTRRSQTDKCAEKRNDISQKSTAIVKKKQKNKTACCSS